MRKTIAIILMFSILASVTCLMGKAQASTPISGIITTDTTWRVSDSPIEFTGPVCILGATLTIEPGVTVNLVNYYLQINGTLKAQGRNDNRITFTANSSNTWPFTVKRIAFAPVSEDWNEQTKTGSIIEYSTLQSVEVYVLESSPKIYKNIFQNPTTTSINIGSGSPFVSLNEITDNAPNSSPAIGAHGSPTITNNTISGNGYQVGIEASNTAYVANNKVSRCWTGIRATDSVSILGNIVVNCYENGIISQSNTVTVQNNYIANNKHNGFIGGGTVQRNTIANHEIGVKDPFSTITLTNNNILNSSKYNLYLSTTDNLDNAINNYWGTTDVQAINQSIRDFKNDFNLGKVNFVPFLNQPVDIGVDDDSITQPIITPTPWPTPTASQNTNTPQPTGTPNQIPKDFSIQTNSTVTAFSYDGNIPQISFIVSGPEGTSGYLTITIAKTFMPNSNIIVYLDGSQIQYDLSSSDTTWIVTFSYHHSSHQITINSSENSNTNWIWGIAIALAAIGIALAAVLLVRSAKNKPRIDSMNQP